MIVKIFSKNIKWIVLITVFAVSLIFVQKVDISALYYGTRTSQFPQSGYIFVNVGGGKASQCGINYIAPNVGLTAAHCIDDGTEVFAGSGNYTEDFHESSPSVDYFNYSPRYNETDFSRNPGLADVGVVVFDDPVSVSDYAFITSPSVGCNYYLVGYGRNQEGSDFRRTGTDVCIKNISSEAFELEFSGRANFCQGDSGSGIYEKGTNNIVGLVSAYYNRLGDSGCDNALAYVATRIDANLDYLSNHIPESSYIEDLPNIEDPLPDDYFGDLYPETRDDDGTFNYENEILLEIEKLEKLFEDIYPEDDDFGTTTTPYPTFDFDNFYDDPEEYIQLPNTSNSDEDGSLLGGLILIFLGFCCCILLIMAILVPAIFIISNNKKKKQV